MANDVHNMVTIKGAPDRLLALRRHVGEDFNFGSIVPEAPPTEEFWALLLHRRGAVAGDKPSWNDIEWGAYHSVGAHVDARDPSPDQLVYLFDTRWIWPQPILTLLAAQYPELEIELKTWSYDFAYQGEIQFRGGVFVQSDFRDMDPHIYDAYWGSVYGPDCSDPSVR